MSNDLSTWRETVENDRTARESRQTRHMARMATRSARSPRYPVRSLADIPVVI